MALDVGVTKICRVCAEAKSPGEFYPNRRECKACNLGRQRRYRETHGAALAAQKRAWYESNVDRCRALMRERYRANAQEAKAKTLAWQRANPDRCAEYGHRRRATIRSATPVSSSDLAAKFAYWGDRCWICGAPNRLEFDHVKPLSRGGAHVLANLRPACKPCNSGKRDRWPVPTKRGW